MLRSQRRGRDPPCWLSEKEPLVGKRRVNFQRCWLPVSRIGLHRRGVERVNCGPKLLDLGEKGVYSSYTSLNPDVTDLFAFRYEDFTLEGYDPHPHIKAKVAV
ncbi:MULTISPECIES: thymidylate synthase [Enterobacteriaceae]|nr:thymidylate synthase [Klebsiella pneumoniae]MBA2123179.1 hypothetical protein [Klebsiella pneumoniae subsp. pneumoniae]OYM32238.1 hypothetical protein CI754_28840 [Klebsiella quasipneumoniae subsp. similipneumoniae]